MPAWTEHHNSRWSATPKAGGIPGFPSAVQGLAAASYGGSGRSPGGSSVPTCDEVGSVAALGFMFTGAGALLATIWSDVRIVDMMTGERSEGRRHGEHRGVRGHAERSSSPWQKGLIVNRESRVRIGVSPDHPRRIPIMALRGPEAPHTPPAAAADWRDDRR